jgi:hypothetical protein
VVIRVEGVVTEGEKLDVITISRNGRISKE